MADKGETEGMLSPYRVLDLTDEKGLICSKMLGDLGADVIKIERPGGDPARNQGPFYHDEVDPEKSLFWFAHNTSKRSITLDIEPADGQELLKRLVKGADFVIESFPPGYLDKLGLGYRALEKLNPGIIMVSITPFGQTGPYKDYKAPGIVAGALGGVIDQFDDIDRPPTWVIGHHSQAYLHAGTEAAAAAMMALYYRGITGEGQQVDVSIQECGTRGANLSVANWQAMKAGRSLRTGMGRSVFTRRMWPCKDGYIMWFWAFGAQAKRRNQPLLQWIDEAGMSTDFLRGFDWDAFDLRSATQETINRLIEPTEKFFMAHTKAELFDGAMKRRIMLYPVSTTKDILESVQLGAREFWAEVEHPELGTTITYPGAFVNASETPPRISRRAPLIGEHNDEVYEKELGISREELVRLEQARVI